MSRPRLFCLNRCLVVRKGIAEMVADASTHAVMYQVEGTRRYTTIKDFLQTRIFLFTTFIAYFRVFSPPPKISSPFKISYEQFAYESLKFGGPSWPQWKIHP